jgi:hypothetical protein
LEVVLVSTHPRRLRTAHSVTTWAAITLGSIAIGLLATPAQSTEAFGQHFSVDSQPPSLSLSGPAEMTELGSPVTLPASRIYGPARARFSGGLLDLTHLPRDPAVAKRDLQTGGSNLAHAWFQWCKWAACIVVCCALALWGYVAFDNRRGLHRWARVRLVLAGALTALVVFALLAGAGTVGMLGLTQAKTLGQLFGTHVVQMQPDPAGPLDTSAQGAVIGNSVASHVGGSGDVHAPCDRSSDSLASWLTRLTGLIYRNLSCSSASIPKGLLGPQYRDGHALPSQVSYLYHMANLSRVVVVIGQNDVGWSFQMGMCLGTTSCNNDLGSTDFHLRLSQFSLNYADLLYTLHQLPSHPGVTVVASYQLMSPESVSPKSHCLDAHSFSPSEVHMMRNYTRQLNAVLTAGAARYHDQMAWPHLHGLCPDAGQSQDIVPIWKSPGHINPDAAHPTPQGEAKIAVSVIRALPFSAISAAGRDGGSPPSPLLGAAGSPP